MRRSRRRWDIWDSHCATKAELEGLRLLFDRTGGADIQAALDEQSNAAPTRRIAYLFEWLTGKELELRAGPLDKKLRYVPLLDEKLQFGLALGASPRAGKFRVIDNLPGTPAFVRWCAGLRTWNA